MGRPKGAIVSCAAFGDSPTCKGCQLRRKYHRRSKSQGCECTLCANMDDAGDTQEPGSDQDQGKQSHLALSSMTRRQQQTPAKTPIATKTNKQRNTTPPFETHAARAIWKTNKRKRKERHEREKSKQQSTGKWRFTHGSLFFSSRTRHVKYSTCLLSRLLAGNSACCSASEPALNAIDEEIAEAGMIFTMV